MFAAVSVPSTGQQLVEVETSIVCRSIPVVFSGSLGCHLLVYLIELVFPGGLFLFAVLDVKVIKVIFILQADVFSKFTLAIKNFFADGMLQLTLELVCIFGTDYL